MKDINKIIDSLSPGEQNVMYNALRVKLDKKPEYTISKDEHGYYVSSHKIVIYSRRRVDMAAVDLDANTYK